MTWVGKKARHKGKGIGGVIVNEENQNRYMTLVIEWEDGTEDVIQMSNTVYDNDIFPSSAYSHVLVWIDGLNDYYPLH